MPERGSGVPPSGLQCGSWEACRWGPSSPCRSPPVLLPRPGVYREYMRDLCDRVSNSQSHNIHKLVGFEPFAPAALAFRIAATAAALRASSGGAAQPAVVAAAAAWLAAVWLLLLAAKLGLGYLLKLTATAYMRHYETKRGTRPARRSAVLQHPPLPTAAAPAKKEE